MSARGKSKGFANWEAGWKLDSDPQLCAQPGCGAEGVHRAPKGRDRMDEYYWFCLDHARDYNAGWNFFDGMEPEDIHRFQHDNAFWHRPTWSFSDRVVGQGSARNQDAKAGPEVHIHDPFDFFEGRMGTPAQKFRERRDGSLKPLDAKELKALSVLGLGAAATAVEIKAAFKRLAKELHPDKTGGNQILAARFQEVTAAYQYCVTAGIC